MMVLENHLTYFPSAPTGPHQGGGDEELCLARPHATEFIRKVEVMTI